MKFIIVGIDYSKWVEAEPLKKSLSRMSKTLFGRISFFASESRGCSSQTMDNNLTTYLSGNFVSN